MLEQLDEEFQLISNPSFTGTIELFPSLQHKTVDRYYARATYVSGKLHGNTIKTPAIYLNYKDEQYVELYNNGTLISIKQYNCFDDAEVE